MTLHLPYRIVPPTCQSFGVRVVTRGRLKELSGSPGVRSVSL